MGGTRTADAWLELVATLLAAPLTEFPERQLAEQLVTTFHARGVAFSQRSANTPIVQRLWPADEEFNGHRADIQSWSVHQSPSAHPVLRFYLSTLQPIPLQVHDVPDAFADRRIKGGWLERASEWGTPGNVAVPLDFTATSHSAFVIGRVDPFTSQELSLLSTLQRLLIGLTRQIAGLNAVTRTPIALESASAARLTVREFTVLGLIAEGLTAAAVGRRLGIAETTVHKHLQRVYGKLDVRDRLGAVLRAQHLGLLAPTGPGKP
jgi:DNA-binding CsgD family transcriptional regulator